MLERSETFLMLTFFLLILLFAISVLRRAEKLEESKRFRVRDLIVVGFILSFSPTIQVAGILIFWYGFGILLYEYYKLGKSGAGEK